MCPCAVTEEDLKIVSNIIKQVTKLHMMSDMTHGGGGAEGDETRKMFFWG